MEGEEISISELKTRYESGKERVSDPLQITEKTYLDLFEPYIYGNHSCNPNSTIKGRNELIAIKDIAKDEEITYDYSLTEWSDENSWQNYNEWSMECLCGYSQCRKIITEFNLLPKELQIKSINNKNVRDFIVDKFKKCHGEE